MPSTEFPEARFDLSLNMARQSLYRFLSLCLLDPKQGSWEQLNLLRREPVLYQAAELIRELPEMQPDKLGRGEYPIEGLDPHRVLRQLPDAPGALNEEYERTFGLLVANACPPYETEYVHSKLTFQRSNAMADLNGFYQAFGLTASASHPERADHIVLELEFMSFLLGMERRAVEEGASQNNERLEVCRGAQERFLKEHLAWWTPTFARLLGMENSGGFFVSVGVFLASFIPAERAWLRVSLQDREIQPSVAERLEDCEHCQLSEFA